MYAIYHVGILSTIFFVKMCFTLSYCFIPLITSQYIRSIHFRSLHAGVLIHTRKNRNSY